MTNTIESNISLKAYNTFGLNVKAASFFSATTEEDLRSVLLAGHKEKFILGGGSNMLLTQDLNALVIHIALKGIEILEKNNNTALVKVAGGENWHDFVTWAINNDLGGVENLSLIPGNTGTAPIQNIGAYGVELKDVFHSCEALHIDTAEKRTFTHEECRFGYRDSIFKRELKGQYVITNVTFCLTTTQHKLRTDYGAIREELQRMNVGHPDIAAISKAVIAIRRSKLPDPAEIGNSGSFFKNPVIEAEQFEALRSSYPEIPSYPAPGNRVKVPAGWLIEKCGLKGYRKNDVGIHEKQALVLVNYGEATGKELLELSQLVQEKVFKKFGIAIEAEVNII